MRNRHTDVLRKALADVSAGQGAATMGSSGTGRTESATKASNDKKENERSRDR